MCWLTVPAVVHKQGVFALPRRACFQAPFDKGELALELGVLLVPSSSSVGAGVFAPEASEEGFQVVVEEGVFAFDNGVVALHGGLLAVALVTISSVPQAPWVPASSLPRAATSGQD